MAARDDGMIWHAIVAGMVMVFALAVAASTVALAHRRGWTDLDAVMMFVNGATFAAAALSIVYARQVRQQRALFAQTTEEIARETAGRVPEIVMSILRDLQEHGAISREVEFGQFDMTGKKPGKMN